MTQLYMMRSIPKGPFLYKALLGAKQRCVNQFIPRSTYAFFTKAEDPPAGGRQRLVILGTGWASYALLKSVDKRLYDVIVVSPRNHFLFTPLLASTTVGTLEFRSGRLVRLRYVTLHVTFMVLLSL